MKAQREQRASHVVVVGYGMAGARLVEELRARDPLGRRTAITVAGAETHRAYNRVLLSSVLAGDLTGDDVLLHDAGWAPAHRVAVRAGTAVTGLDRAARCVTLADGTRLPYDHLVLATGSRPRMPVLDGVRATDRAADGVFAFRTLADCEGIVAAAKNVRRIAVLGGGVLGLEAARGLAGRGVGVTVVHPRAHLMERQLDGAAARMLRRRLRELGVETRLRSAATGWRPGVGLVLDSGEVLPAGALVVAAGVRPDTDLAVKAGLAVDRGITVDDRMTTSDPRVHALGDCAEHPGAASGFVQPAWEQAAVLADILTGTDPYAAYQGTPIVTRLKARDIDLASLGEIHTVDDDDDEAETVTLSDPAGGRYARIVLRQDRVVGAITLGLPDAAALVTQLYDQGAPAPSDRLALLLGRVAAAGDASPASLSDSAVVCRCNTVTKGRLAEAWHAGARSVPALARATRATTGCGGCRDVVARLAAGLAPEPDAEEGAA